MFDLITLASGAIGVGSTFTKGMKKYVRDPANNLQTRVNGYWVEKEKALLGGGSTEEDAQDVPADISTLSSTELAELGISAADQADL